MTTKPVRMTKSKIAKLLDVIDAGLVSGLGQPEPGKMCVEAAVCYVLGLKHSAEPACVSPYVRGYMIRLNDANWSSNAARAKGLRRAAVAQLGSDGIDGEAWLRYVAQAGVNRILPLLLRKLAGLERFRSFGERLEAAAIECESANDPESARSAARNARPLAQQCYVVADAAYAAARDEILSIAADIGVEACIASKTQGSRWLNAIT